MAVLVVVLCVFFLSRMTNCIDCPKSDSCRCTENAACDLNCVGNNVCKGDSFDIQCKAGFPCTITCDGQAACQTANINGSAATDVTIICEGKDACQDADISGTGAKDVTVICNGTSSCKGNTHIRCGTGACHLECYLTDACQNAQVDVETAASFQCTGNGCSYDSIPDPFTASPTDVPSPRPTTISPTPVPSDNRSTNPSNAPSQLLTTFFPSTEASSSTPTITTAIDKTPLPTSIVLTMTSTSTSATTSHTLHESSTGSHDAAIAAVTKSVFPWWGYTIVAMGVIVCCSTVVWSLYVRFSSKRHRNQQPYLQEVPDKSIEAIHFIENKELSSDHSDGDPSTHHLGDLVNRMDDDNNDMAHNNRISQFRATDRRSIYSEGQHKESIVSACSEGVMKTTGNDDGVDDVPNHVTPGLAHVNIGRESFIVIDEEEE